MTEEEAKQRHPAGKLYIPRVKILERLQTIVQENYWLYGVATVDHPNAAERWDVRSMIDYAVMTTSDAQMGFMNYGQFYMRRNAICQMLMEMKEFLNWGEWRMWETDADRTQMQILSVINRALEAEKASAKV